ncbi:hypothetical protein BLNAU_8070 [Blattamonas nauphoetae]|uniref:Secreted protein n=1 Tax=Blattamonas nauphoetae TaxID=2049346 RepID=A0ABQ9XZV4_9EUKA|nr:hypothetical protein BLNAU_8070 [Blattamonas nauphoetae]
MVATLSFSFAATFTLSHCSNCSEMEAVDADDWLEIVFCCCRRCDAISESIHIVDRRRHFGKAKDSKWMFMHNNHSLLALSPEERY